MDLLRVHSQDLHDHIAQEVGECLESGDANTNVYFDFVLKYIFKRSTNVYQTVILRYTQSVLKYT